MQRARLRRPREATRELAGRKNLATCVTDAVRAILTEGSLPLFPFLLCEGRLSPVRARWEDPAGQEAAGWAETNEPGKLESGDQRP